MTLPKDRKPWSVVARTPTGPVLRYCRHGAGGHRGRLSAYTCRWRRNQFNRDPAQPDVAWYAVNARAETL